MVYLKSVEKVITLGKLIGLLFFPLYFVFEIRGMTSLPVMGTIFLVIGRAKRAPH